MTTDATPLAIYLRATWAGVRFDSPVKTSFAFPASDVKALLAPRNILSLILSRWPRYFNHGPAGEMWSVVHFPFALIRIGSFAKSFPSHTGNGFKIWSRSLVGGI